LPFTDFCQAAIGPLPTNGFEFFSTTRTATVDDFDRCGFDITSAGVSFTVVGTGDRLSASTCNKYTYFEARASIFQPRNKGNSGLFAQCDDLECVDESADALYSLCNGSKGSLVSWKSTDRQVYYVLVHGHETETGPFGLTIDFQVSNDFCEDAAPVTLGQGVISGSTISGTVDTVGSCGDAENSAAGVWYLVEGTGQSITASICNDETDNDLHLSVFEGSCGDLKCLSGSSQFDCGVVSWDSFEYVAYYVLVSGGGVGNFELVIDESTHDFCAGATQLFIGADPIIDTTELATRDRYNEAVRNHGGVLCILGDSTYDPGLWFVVTPEKDSLLVASTCYSATILRTAMVIFEGSCGEMTCVIANSSGASRSCSRVGSQAQFYAEQGKPYYIYVNGFGTGQFMLGIEEFSFDDAPGNDLCSGAFPASVGSSVEGTTMGASIADFNFFEPCPPASNPLSQLSGAGVWYVLDPIESSQNLTVSACDPSVEDDFLIAFHMFSGSCDGLECVSVQSNNCLLHWEAQEGITYYLLVHSQSQQGEGKFSRVEISQFAPLVNDRCAEALSLYVGDETVRGSTLGAREEDESWSLCGDGSISSGYAAWYIFQPTESQIVALDTCHGGTSYGAGRFDVFLGSCDDLVCVPESDALEGCEFETWPPPPGGGLSWNAVAESTYYIYISGEGRDVGYFEISLTGS
jgi:hypothetical protein